MPSNLAAREGTVSGELEIVFPWKPRHFTITNDSTSGELKFKFNESEEWATLKPTETVEMDIAHKIILLQGNGIPYRIWGTG